MKTSLDYVEQGRKPSKECTPLLNGCLGVLGVPESADYLEVSGPLGYHRHHVGVILQNYN